MSHNNSSPQDEFTSDEALAEIFNAKADPARINDILLFGAFYDWSEERTKNGKKRVLKDFAYEYSKRADSFVPSKLDSTMMSQMFTRLEKHFQNLLVPRTYGESNQNLGDVYLKPGAVVARGFTRDPSRVTEFGGIVARLARILRILMVTPSDETYSLDYVQFLDTVEVGLRAQHVLHTRLVSEHAANKAKEVREAVRHARSPMTRLARNTARAEMVRMEQEANAPEEDQRFIHGGPI